MTGFSTAWPQALSAATVAYVTVLLAELVGDKSIYTIAALSLRFRRGPVFCGMALAFALKMLAAVLFGTVLMHIPGQWTKAVGAVGFFVCSLLIWFRESPGPAVEGKPEAGWSGVALFAFTSLFFTEWCDTGQLAVAAVAAHTQVLAAVWLGGMAALLTKGTLAMFLGKWLGAVIPERAVRLTASASYCTLGVLSLVELFI